jgi:hypothetical protein
MHMLLPISALAFAALVCAAPANATCKCLNRGVEVPEGKTACIKTSTGPQLALCEKNLNVTNWKFLREACPTAMNGDGPPTEHKIALLVK